MRDRIFALGMIDIHYLFLTNSQSRSGIASGSVKVLIDNAAKFIQAAVSVAAITAGKAKERDHDGHDKMPNREHQR